MGKKKKKKDEFADALLCAKIRREEKKEEEKKKDRCESNGRRKKEEEEEGMKTRAYAVCVRECELVCFVTPTFTTIASHPRASISFALSLLAFLSRSNRFLFAFFLSLSLSPISLSPTSSIACVAFRAFRFPLFSFFCSPSFTRVHRHTHVHTHTLLKKHLTIKTSECAARVCVLDQCEQKEKESDACKCWMRNCLLIRRHTKHEG